VSAGLPETVTLDYLWLEVEVAMDPAVLSLLVNSSTSTLRTRESLRISASPSSTGGWIAQIGLRRHRAVDAAALGELAYGAVHDRVARWAREEGWARLHAGLADIDGRRVVIAGPSGVGKTTTMVALADAGATALGDEGVLIREGLAIALPRPFHAKHAGSGIAGLQRQSVLTVLDYPDPIAILDPAAINRVPSLRHEPSPIDLIVLLERSDTAQPVAQKATVGEAIVALAPDAGPFTIDRGELVRSVVSLAESAPIIRLSMSDPDSTARAIMDLL
jgi:hypothetical protein